MTRETEMHKRYRELGGEGRRHVGGINEEKNEEAFTQGDSIDNKYEDNYCRHRGKRKQREGRWPIKEGRR